MQQVRVPPHDLEAEQALIGGILHNNKYLPLINKILSPDDFYREAHVLIFNAMLKLKESKIEIDLITLKDHFEKVNVLDKIGGMGYLVSLVQGTITSVSWEYHSNIIKERSLRRKIISMGINSAEKAFSPMENVDDILSENKNAIIDIDRDKNTEIIDNPKLAMDTYKGIFEKKDPGLYTGIQGIDKKFYLEDGYIHCIAAESGVGKSALLLQIMDYIAQTYQKDTLFYSLESTNQKLMRRWLCRHVEIPLTCINKNNFNNEGQIEEIQIACEEFGRSFLRLIDNSNFIYIERLISHAESYFLNNDVSIICIDFLQALDSIKSFSSDRSKINYFITRIKTLAKELNIPVLYTCQLRKDINGRPKLDDLIESNYIRTHTDNILFLYAPDSDPVIYSVECFLAKGKEQERFSQWLEFNGNFQIFYKGDKPLEMYKKNNKGFVNNG